MNIGEYAKWYRPAEPGEIDDAFSEDVQEVLDSYGLKYVGWAVARDEYFDDFMDNNIEYCLIAQDPNTHNIGVYEWVDDRLYDPKDEIEMIEDDLLEEGTFKDISIHEALKEAFSLQEALINPQDVEDMDDMELEEFLQDNLNDAEQQVLGKLGLYLEPNGYGRIGTFVIYDNDSNELAEISFEDYIDNELNIAYECNTVKQYQKKYTSWLKTLLPKKKSNKKIYTCPEANPPGCSYPDDYTSLPLRVDLRHKSSKSHFDNKYVTKWFIPGHPEYGDLLGASYNAGYFFLESWQEDLKKILDKYFPQYSVEDFEPDPTTYFVVGEWRSWDDDSGLIGYVPVGNKMKKLGTKDKFPLPYNQSHYYYIKDVEGWNKIAAGHIVE